jgi:hypothetical protein
LELPNPRMARSRSVLGLFTKGRKTDEQEAKKAKV